MIGDSPNVDVLTRAWHLRWEDARQRLAVFRRRRGPDTDGFACGPESERTGRLQAEADIQVLEEIRRIRGL